MKFYPALVCALIVGIVIATLRFTYAADAPKVTPDFNAGFCEGWKQAREVEQQRYIFWRNAIVGDAQPSSGVGVALRAAGDSIPQMLLLPPIPDKATISDGRVFDCSPAALTPPAPAPKK